MTKARDVSSRGGLTQVIPTSVTVGSGSGSVTANGTISFSGASTVSINGAFTSQYENYMMQLTNYTGSVNGATVALRMRRLGTDDSGNNYLNAHSGILGGGSANNYTGTSNIFYLAQFASDFGSSIVEFMMPMGSGFKVLFERGFGYTGDMRFGSGGCRFNTTSAHDGFTILNQNSATMNGSIRVYGYNNG